MKEKQKINTSKLFKILTLLIPFGILANVGLKIDEYRDSIPLLTIALGVFGMLLGFMGHYFAENKSIIIKILTLILLFVFCIVSSIFAIIAFTDLLSLADINMR